MRILPFCRQSTPCEFQKNGGPIIPPVSTALPFFGANPANKVYCFDCWSGLRSAAVEPCCNADYKKTQKLLHILVKQVSQLRLLSEVNISISKILPKRFFETHTISAITFSRSANLRWGTSVTLSSMVSVSEPANRGSFKECDLIEEEKSLWLYGTTFQRSLIWSIDFFFTKNSTKNRITDSLINFFSKIREPLSNVVKTNIRARFG